MKTFKITSDGVAGYQTKLVDENGVPVQGAYKVVIESTYSGINTGTIYVHGIKTDLLFRGQIIKTLPSALLNEVYVIDGVSYKLKPVTGE